MRGYPEFRAAREAAPVRAAPGSGRGGGAVASVTPEVSADATADRCRLGCGSHRDNLAAIFERGGGGRQSEGHMAMATLPVSEAGSCWLSGIREAETLAGNPATSRGSVLR